MFVCKVFFVSTSKELMKIGLHQLTNCEALHEGLLKC